MTVPGVADTSAGYSRVSLENAQGHPIKVDSYKQAIELAKPGDTITTVGLNGSDHDTIVENTKQVDGTWSGNAYYMEGNAVYEQGFSHTSYRGLIINPDGTTDRTENHSYERHKQES